MTPNLEDRLGTHLRNRAAASVGQPDQLGAVRTVARRRTMRNRAATGLCGLIALVGAASLVPTGDGSSALITAADPTVPEQLQVDVVDPGSADGIDGEAAAAASDDDDPVTASAPPPHRIVGDGAGGFAAISVTTRTGRTEFVRSEDGRTWYDAGEVQVGEDLFFSNLQHIDGFFVAIVDEQRPGATTGGYINPQVAVSADLVDWRLIGFAERPPRSDRWIGDVAIANGQVMVRVSDVRSIDYAAYDMNEMGVCGGSQTPDATSVTLCSGELVQVDVDDFSTRVPTNWSYFLASEGETTFSAIDAPSDAEHLDIYGSDGEIRFAAVRPPSATVTDDDAEVATLLVGTNADGHALTMLGDGDRIATRPAGSDAELSFLPSAVSVPGPAGVIPQLAAGPAGWVALVTEAEQPMRLLRNDDWTLEGVLPGLFVNITSADGAERFWYGSRSTVEPPPFVELGMFGEVRFLRPGTDEVLFEVSGDDTRASQAALYGSRYQPPASGSFDRTLNVDGWILRGDPFRGPLTLTSPDGAERVFDDGFAFLNGDASDGVEIDLGELPRDAYSLGGTQAPMRFFDDGQQIASIPAADIFAALIVPVVFTENDDGTLVLPSAVDPAEHQSWLVHSVDGTTWSIVQEVEGFNFNTRTSIAVGDDEVLLVDPSGVTRIELDS